MSIVYVSRLPARCCRESVVVRRYKSGQIYATVIQLLFVCLQLYSAVAALEKVLPGAHGTKQ